MPLPPLLRLASAAAVLPLLAGCELFTGSDEKDAVEITLESNVLVAGMSLPLKAQATGGTPEWESSHPAVAEIGPGGVLLARAEGEALLTARLGAARDTQRVRVAPDAVPLLRRPFDIPARLNNPFDHRYPDAFSDSQAGVVDWQGTALTSLNGHRGYDWSMPVGTPLVAAAAGRVSFAGTETPWQCPLLGNATVAAQIVSLVHTLGSGERVVSMYVHLDRIDVQQGDQVQAGQVIGLSGNTGCSTGPHLHFEVFRERYQRQPRANGARVTDPSGWRGAGLDPWVMHADGVASTRLWIPGQEPSLIRGMVASLQGEDAPAAPLDHPAPDGGWVPLPPR